MLYPAFVAAFLAASCNADDGRIQAFGKETLFTLSYGKTDSELEMFERDMVPLKTRIAMRAGLFFVSNGGGRKILKFSSYGDLLSSVYNPAFNPEPLLLEPFSGGDFSLKTAQQYPFEALGELAVDSEQTIYVEDKVPAGRRVFDEKISAMLAYAVLRFDANGTFKDFLGQEGIGGTPFPIILSVKVGKNDDCVVISMSQDAWFVHRFNKAGVLLHAITVPRKGLPDPTGEGLIAELDKIIPDPDGENLLLKIDYFRVDLDPQTKTQSGVSFASSYILNFDTTKNEYTARWELPAFIVRKGDATQAQSRVWELLGAARGGRLYLLVTDAEGATYLGVFELGSRTLKKYALDIEGEALRYSAYHLSEEGILTALLASEYEAKVVWWRFDRLFGQFTE